MGVTSCVLRLHQRHGHTATQSRAPSHGSHLTNRLSRRVRQYSAPAVREAIHDQGYPTVLRTLGHEGEIPSPPEHDMVPHLALAQAPHQGCLDGIVSRGDIDTGAVKATLHPQHIQSVHTNRTDVWVRQKLGCHGLCCFPWQHQFEPILTAQPSPDAGNLRLGLPMLQVEVDVGEEGHGRQRVGRQRDVVRGLSPDLPAAENRLEHTLGRRPL
mmetsp:Transcript_36039/g.94321  ORF Transcript_36039/g.94321 Transcript_36039/m.94321 type:complete len:213 (+) Transcript_36039:852-1490(+)